LINNPVLSFGDMQMKKNEYIIWIGIRESEIAYAGDLFSASITIFGSNKGTNYSFDKAEKIRINYNRENLLLKKFIDETAKKLIIKYPYCKFMFYYPMEAIDFGKEIQERAICINSSALTDILENKLYSKLWLTAYVPTIPFSTYTNRELSYKNLCMDFPDNNVFVLQETFSCGGSGTWLISSEKDVDTIKADLTLDDICTITPYYKNSISVNVHIMIYEKEIIIFPTSVQIIKVENKRLCYGGADYIMASSLPDSIKQKIYKNASIIGNKFQKNGYRGICGIDFLTTEKEVFFMEINARFQSSSFLLNYALFSNKYPSLQELNFEAFIKPVPTVKINNLSVDESFYDYSYNSQTFAKTRYIWDIAAKCRDVQIRVDDYIDWDVTMEDDTYLYKLVFNRNIACVSMDYQCRVYNGFNIVWGLLPDIPWYEQAKRFKTAILNQGIRITAAALDQLNREGGPNYEEFYAIDLVVANRVFINVPYQVPFSELSPFEVDYINNSYVLMYYGKFIDNVSVRTIDPLSIKLTRSGVPYSHICYKGIDRLRVQSKNGCFFKENGIGCLFCGVGAYNKNYGINEIKEIVSEYSKLPEIKHYLVGGGSYEPDSNFKDVLENVKFIKQTTWKNIYLMSIPPFSTGILQELKDAGVTEVAFNLEIFDRDIAHRVMPGKSSITLSKYEEAFKEAVKLWGKGGNVRSALIIGLEPESSVLKGVEFLCKIGVSPILAIFKPDGELENFFAPDSSVILDIWEKTELICKKYNVPLGPSCNYCEDNVLKITL